MTSPPSDRPLHPLSFVFAMFAHGRQLLVPGLLVLFAGARGGEDWQIWAMALFIPLTISAIVRVRLFRYRLGPDEVVIRSGVFFRQERHIPYHRIQNVDAIQNVVHRMLGVIDVRLETAGGEEPEAHLSVVSVAAFEELRESVKAGRSRVPAGVAAGDAAAAERAAAGLSTDDTLAPADAAAARAGVELLRLPARELALCGLIQGRGLLAVGALFGILWEIGLLDRVTSAIFGSQAAGGGVVRQIVKAMFGQGVPQPAKIAWTLAAFAALVVATRVLSVGWALVRLHGFTLRRIGDDLRADFGLFTRVAATIPVRRIQSVTVHEGPIHRWFDRVSVHVDTAGGDSGESVRLQREWLAPVIHRDRVFSLLQQILPGLDTSAVDWQPVDPRGVRRERVRWLVTAMLAAAFGVLLLRWWTPVLIAGVALLGEVDSRKGVRAVGWGLTPTGFCFRSGWMWRRRTFAPVSKIQAVAVHESPFDRRLRMASLEVDTAGTSEDRHEIAVPYLPRATADALAAQLAARAGRTIFKW